MPDELFLKLYKVSLLQYKMASLNIEIMEDYGSVMTKEDVGFVKESYKRMLDNSLSTLKRFWEYRPELLKSSGYTEVFEE